MVDVDHEIPDRYSLGVDYSFKRKILWKFVLMHVLLTTGALIGFYLFFSAKYSTWIWTFLLWFASTQGVMMGAHRLYAHRSFKATFPVRLALIIFHTISGQFTLYRWAKDHRIHHKYTDTDADPFNAARGFFFAHYGWMFVQKHPLVYEKLKQIEDSDLKSDKLVMFQRKYIVPLHFVFALGIPTFVPVLFWNESIAVSLYVCYFFRMMTVAHCIACINSVAHAFGSKPYDKSIRASNKTLVDYVTLGEGWHNYHHTFPWDYRSAELGTDFNVTANLIDFLAYLGLVTDLKIPSQEMIKQRVLRTGDGSHPKYHK